jgi:transcriptional activator of cad operon
MERASTTTLRIGDWRVNPASGQISREGETSRVEVRTMRLLLCLAKHAGEVVSIDELLNEVWSDVTVSPDSVYQAVTSLRRLLGDDAKQPTYIETVPRLGYRMVAKVSPRPQGSAPQSNSMHPLSRNQPTTAANPPPASRRGRRVAWAAGGVLCLALVLVLLLLGKLPINNHSASSAAASRPEKSIAVVPFLDLTEGMRNEEFADGMTEELIDKFSKIPGLRVPSATSSFFFKGKKITIADIAKALGVVYVLDGSVRKSGAQVRVAARLVRAENGYVIWSETYDRPFNDIVMVQDDIASDVTKALRASIEAGPEH